MDKYFSFCVLAPKELKIKLKPRLCLTSPPSSLSNQSTIAIISFIPVGPVSRFFINKDSLL